MDLASHWAGVAVAMLVVSLGLGVKRATWGRYVRPTCDRCGTTDHDALPRWASLVRDAWRYAPTFIGAAAALVPGLPAGFGAESLGARLVYFGLAGALSQDVYDVVKPRLRRLFGGSAAGEAESSALAWVLAIVLGCLALALLHFLVTAAVGP